jgi:hypothetical protein
MDANLQLLERARAAAGRLADAERDALLARAEYHAAIRRLHLAGASLREIAQALALSHQRVQQVVSAAGGSWWQVWKRRGATRDAVCSWCARPPSEVAKLIAGPNVYICDDCLGSVERVLVAGHDAGRRLRRVHERSRHRCDFCRKRAAPPRPLVVGPPHICGDCAAICRDIFDSRSA